MADRAMTGKGMEIWTTTLEQMQKNLAEMLAQASVLPTPPPIEADQPAQVPLARLDQRLLEWDVCLQGMEKHVDAAEASTRGEIAELQAWATKMTEAREKLAAAASRAV